MHQVTAASASTSGPSAEDTPLTEADAALIVRMTRGDRTALAELYGKHAPTLFALSFRILRDRQDAEDLLHDVFLEAWKHCADYAEARGSVRSWLLLRTRSRALDKVRSNARRRAVAADESTASTQLPAAAGAVNADSRRLPAALAQIPEKQQDVIVLSYFEGLTTLEIASRLGIPAGTVKSRTHAAIASLRGALGVADE